MPVRRLQTPKPSRHRPGVGLAMQGADGFERRTPDQPVIRLGQQLRRLAGNPDSEKKAADIEGSARIDDDAIRGVPQGRFRGHNKACFLSELADKCRFRRFTGLHATARKSQPGLFRRISDLDEGDPPPPAGDAEYARPVGPDAPRLGKTELGTGHQSLP